MECPSDDLLIHFTAGLLSEVVREQIRAHLETCDACTTKVTWFQEEWFDGFDDDLEPAAGRTKSVASQDSLHEIPGVFGLPAFEDSFDFSMLLPSQHPDSMGRLGKYEIRGVVGDGAMGIVMKAFEESLQRTVAIKVLKRQVCTSDRARRRFIREARAAAGINHPNVVTIFAVEEQNACPYLVMEYVGGGTLRDHIRKNGPLAPMEVVRLAKGIAEGLAAAHHEGVIHRDIKPGNILLEQGAVRVKITDFGLARAAVDNADLTSHGLAVGTPAYMSPEQVTGKRLDHRTDLFSLGCVIHAMVAGHSPFRGSNQFEIARRILEEMPPRLDEVVEGTPPLLVDLTQRLLAKNPDDRFSSADELAEELGHYLALLNEAPTDEMSGIMRQTRLKAPAATMPAIGRDVEPKSRYGRVMRAMLVIAILLLLTVPLAIWRPWNAKPSHGNTGENPPVLDPGVTGDSVVDPAMAPALILVGDPDTRSDCVATIKEALQRAGPRTVIRVLPVKEYHETIVIDDPSRLAEVTIEGDPDSESRPVLVGTATDAQSSLIRIKGVSGVRIRHLELRTTGGRGIAVESSCKDVILEQLRCSQRFEGGGPAVDLRATATGDGAKPITLRDSWLDCPGPGQCVRLGHPERLQSTVLANNMFFGRGVLVLAEHGVSKVTIRGNVFATPRTESPENAGVRLSTVGLNLDITAPAVVQRIEIYNNTFLDVEYWLGLVHTEARDKLAIRFCNNLILGSESIQDDRGRINEIAKNWTFQGNCWQLTQGAGGWHPENWDVIADLDGDFTVLDRQDPTSPDFLRPPPGSPLCDSGVEDPDLPRYVGAKPPDDADLPIENSQVSPSSQPDDRSATP